MKVKQKPNKELFNAISQLNKAQVKTGWFESAKYEDGTPVAAVAYKNEFGDPANNQPPRPAVRLAVSGNKTAWAKTSEGLAKKIFNGANIKTNLNLLGTVIQADIQKSISILTAPALNPNTIKARKSKLANGRKIEKSIEKPLIDSGLELATVTSEVKI